MLRLVIILLVCVAAWPAAANDRAPYTVRGGAPPLAPTGAGAGRAKYLLLISLDGVSWEHYLRYRHLMPNLRALAKAGFARPVETVFPSMTWSAHVSMVTGQYPRHHGVIANRWIEGQRDVRPYQSDFVEEERRRRTPSLYDLAAERGWHVAALNWPGTQGAKITYNWPETMHTSALAYGYMSSELRVLLNQLYREDTLGEKWPTKHLGALVGELARSERLEADMLMRELATRLVHKRHERLIPRVMLAHVVSPDTWMHKYGAAPWIVRFSLELVDKVIGQILDAYRRAHLLSQTAVLVTSDHGFVNISQTMDLGLLLAQKGFIRSRFSTREPLSVVLNGNIAFIHVNGKGESKLPAAIQLIRGKAYNKCVEAVYLPREYRRLGLPTPSAAEEKPRPEEHPGAPAAVVMARPHCKFVAGGAKVLRQRKEWRNGSHGYLPTHRKLWALLIGKGPGLRGRARVLSRAYTVDIAPTAAYWLGLRWPARWPSYRQGPFLLDGRVLHDLFR